MALPPGKTFEEARQTTIEMYKNKVAVSDPRWIAFHEHIPVHTHVRWIKHGIIMHGFLLGGKNGVLYSRLAGSYITYYLNILPDGEWCSHQDQLETDVEYFLGGRWKTYEEAVGIGKHRHIKSRIPMSALMRRTKGLDARR